MARRLLDTRFVIRFRMALWRCQVDWKSSTDVGRFFGKSKQTVSRWLRGGYPHVTEWPLVLEKLHEKAPDVPFKWLLLGDDPPDWVLDLKEERFNQEKPDAPARRFLPKRQLPNTAAKTRSKK